MNQKEQSGYLYVVISSVAYGTMPLLANLAYAAGFNTYMVAMGRFFFGFLFILTAGLIAGKKIRLAKENIPSLIILSLINTSVPICLYASYRYIDTGLATVLHFTYPLSALLILAVFYKEKFSKQTVLSVMLCLCGIFLTYNPTGKINIKGMGLALLSGLLWALYMTTLDHSPLKKTDSLVLTCFLLGADFLETLLFSLLSKTFQIPPSFSSLLPLIGIGFFATILGFFFFQKGLLLCGSMKASLFSTLEPVVCILIGIIILHETMTIRSFASILLILGSTFLVINYQK